MKIVPNTDCRIHILACDFFVSEEGQEFIDFVCLPVVAWEVRYDREDGLYSPRPVTTGGYVPETLDFNGAVASLIFYPHEGKYGGYDPLELKLLERAGAEAYLVDNCRERTKVRRRKAK